MKSVADDSLPKLIVGLGNPGKKYQDTRHNIGFMVLDQLANEFSSSFNEDKKWKASWVKTSDYILVKPLTYMNESVQAVGKIAAFHKIDPHEVVVIYDDMVRTGGSLIKAAKAYKAAGAQKIYAVCSHGVFPKEAWQVIQESQLFAKVISTDSHPRTGLLKSKGLEVLSTSSVFSEALKKIYSS